MSSGPSTPPAGSTALTTSAAGSAGVSRAGSAATELAAFLTELIEYQCRLVGGVAGAVYLAGSGSRSGGIAATFTGPAPWAAAGSVRPEEFTSEAVTKRIERLGADAVTGAGGAAPQRAAVEELSIGAAPLYEARATHRLIASPLSAEGRVEGASVILSPITGAIGAPEALIRLAASAARFEAFLWRSQCLGEAAQRATLRETLEMLDAALQSADAPSMAAIMCHELRRRFACTRVSVGLIGGDAVRLIAVSGSDDLDRRGPAVKSIEAAMEECAAQDIEVMFPPSQEAEPDPAQRRVTRAHEELSRKFGPAAMLSLPLRVGGDLAGVMLLERESTDPFPLGAAGLLRLVGEFVGPAVYTRRLADRGILAVVRDRTIEFGEGIVGPRHTGAKLLGLLVLASILLLAVVPIPARITAAGEVKATVSRAIVAPFTGYLSSVKAKAGDAVKAGDELAAMDATDLELQLAQMRAEQSTFATQRDEAQARAEPSKARALEAQIAESRAGIDMTLDKIARSTIRSPIDGVLSRGDLDPFVGARIDPSQPLMEVAAPGRTVIVRIPERDIHRIASRLASDGRVSGWFAPKSLPGERVPLSITSVNPSATSAEGSSVFLAEASVEGDPAWLRPGMTGTVKLQDGLTTGLVTILRPLADEFRLRWWW